MTFARLLCRTVATYAAWSAVAAIVSRAEKISRACADASAAVLEAVEHRAATAAGGAVLVATWHLYNRVHLPRQPTPGSP